jgi:hypothetical protein
METIFAKLGWKKVAALLIAVSLFGLVFVFFSLTDADKAALLNKKSGQIPSSNSGNSNLEITKAPQQKSLENSAKTYITQYFEVSYPASFISAPGVEKSGTLNSLVLTDSKSNAKVEIRVFDSLTVSPQSLSQKFSVLGYKTATQNAQLPGQILEGKLSSGGETLHEKVAILEKGNNVMQVICSYKSSIALPEKESEFNSILQSIK